MRRRGKLLVAALIAAVLLCGCRSTKNSSERACETVTAQDVEQTLRVEVVRASPASPGEPLGVCHYELDDERFPGLPGLPVYGITISLSANGSYVDALREVPLDADERAIDVGSAERAVITTEQGGSDEVVTASLELIQGSRMARIQVPTVATPEEEQEDVLLMLAALVVDRWLDAHD